MTTSSTPATARAAVHTVDGAQRARHARRGRDHHDARRAGDARRRRARAKRVAHDHVFQRKAGFKSQASGTQAADRARRDLDQDRAAVGFAPAQLGVDGTGLRPSARAAAATVSAMRR